MNARSTLPILLVLLGGPSLADVRRSDAPVEYSSGEYLKNFALSICISHAYESEEVRKDSLAAAGGYFNLGSFPLEAYEEVDALSKTFLAKQYQGIHGERLDLMKCVDLFHSKELDQIIRKHDGTGSPRR